MSRKIRKRGLEKNALVIVRVHVDMTVDVELGRSAEDGGRRTEDGHGVEIEKGLGKKLKH